MPPNNQRTGRRSRARRRARARNRPTQQVEARRSPSSLSFQPFPPPPSHFPPFPPFPPFPFEQFLSALPHLIHTIPRNLPPEQFQGAVQTISAAGPLLRQAQQVRLDSSHFSGPTAATGSKPVLSLDRNTNLVQTAMEATRIFQPSPSAPRAERQTPKLPDFYKGDSFQEYQGWVRTVDSYLQSNDAEFPTENDKVKFALGRTQGAARVVCGRLQKIIDFDSFSYKEFKELLRNHIENTNDRGLSALSRFSRDKQHDSRTVKEFEIIFRDMLGELKRWPNSNTLFWARLFFEKLKPSLRDALPDDGTPDDHTRDTPTLEPQIEQAREPDIKRDCATSPGQGGRDVPPIISPAGLLRAKRQLSDGEPDGRPLKRIKLENNEKEDTMDLTAKYQCPKPNGPPDDPQNSLPEPAVLNAQGTAAMGASQHPSSMDRPAQQGRDLTETATTIDKDWAAFVKENPVPRDMCLRCSSHLAKDRLIRCQRASRAPKCSHCQKGRGRKLCESVPAECKEQLEELQKAARLSYWMNDSASNDRLIALQKSYDTAIKAHKHAHKGKLRQPVASSTSAVADSPSILATAVAENTQALRQVNASLRCLVNLLAKSLKVPVPLAAEDGADDNDGGTHAGEIIGA